MLMSSVVLARTQGQSSQLPAVAPRIGDAPARRGHVLWDTCAPVRRDRHTAAHASLPIHYFKQHPGLAPHAEPTTFFRPGGTATNL